MTPTFRYGVMAINDHIEENIVKYEGPRKEYKGKEIDDNVLHQL